MSLLSLNELTKEALIQMVSEQQERFFEIIGLAEEIKNINAKRSNSDLVEYLCNKILSKANDND